MAVAGSGGMGAVADLWTRRVPNWMTLTVAAFGIALATFGHSAVGVGGALGGFALGLLLMLPGHVIGATGAGDVKLFAALGTLLGPRGIGIAFVYTAIAGGVLALVVAACSADGCATRSSGPRCWCAPAAPMSRRSNDASSRQPIRVRAGDRARARSVAALGLR